MRFANRAGALRYIDIVKSAELEKFMRVVQEIVEICPEGSKPSAA
jgi:hypothetical protein